jgi:acyl-CoA synthetase (AMP-forming)/AMP-acid ligase II
VPEAAVTVQTSGTTRRPERLPVDWATFVASGGGPQGGPARSGRGAIILTLPLVTLGGYLSVARLVFLGRPLAMMERFDVHAWAALVKEHRPRVIGAPPPVVAMILDAGISADHFDGVTAYTTGSAAVPVELKRAFEERYGIPVLVGYGATEFLDSVTTWTPELWAEFGAEKAASAGRPRPGVRLRVLDPATLAGSPREVPIGEEGILEVDPPARAAHLPAGWLRTNDRARLDEDGFLWVLGRADDVIVRGGFKVDLQAVREALLTHPAVAEAEVVGLHDDRLGEVPGAVVVLADDAAPPSESELQGWLRDRCPPYAVPVVIEQVDAVPRTPTSKVHRVRIQETLSRVRSDRDDA